MRSNFLVIFSDVVKNLRSEDKDLKSKDKDKDLKIDPWGSSKTTTLGNSEERLSY